MAANSNMAPAAVMLTLFLSLRLESPREGEIVFRKCSPARKKTTACVFDCEAAKPSSFQLLLLLLSELLHCLCFCSPFFLSK